MMLKIDKKKTIAIVATLTVFAIYNAVLFIVSGLVDHGAAFWISYVFMLTAFVFIALNAALQGKRPIQPKDFLLGYPVLKHSVIYTVVEFIVSTLFMCLDKAMTSGAIPAAVQLVLLAVHIVFLSMCYYAKETREELQQKVNTSTQFMRKLRTDVDTIADRISDAETKKVFSDFAEELRYSDPVSSAALSDVEARLSEAVDDAADALADGKNDEAQSLCRKARLILKERNRLCKELKEGV
jgi:hypothetical protein